MESIHPLALFRYSVLGPLVCRDRLSRGELKATLEQLARQPYYVPGKGSCYLEVKTIEAWYYAWRRGSIAALEPKRRLDRGTSDMDPRRQTPSGRAAAPDRAQARRRARHQPSARRDHRAGRGGASNPH